MSGDEAVIRVSLDTRQAKADLNGLVREGQRSAGGIGQVVGGMGSQIAGMGLARMGAYGAALGGAFAIGAPLLGPSLGAARDVTRESFGSMGAKINDFIFGKLDDEGRAAQSAREQTIGAFGVIAGATNQIPPGAKQFFDQIKALRLNEEKGRSLFENDNNFYGPKITDLIDRLLKGMGELLTNLGDRFVSAIQFWK